MAIEDQVAAGEFRHVAMFRIVRHIALKENDAMAQSMKGPDQAPPQRRMPIAPRGADGQPEDDEFHTLSMSEVFRIRRTESNRDSRRTYVDRHGARYGSLRAGCSENFR